MTNGVALGLGFVITAALAVDFFVYDFEGALFLARKMIALIEWLAFWR